MTSINRELIGLAVSMALGNSHVIQEQWSRAQEAGAAVTDLEDVLVIVHAKRLEASLAVDNVVEDLLHHASLELPITASGPQCGCASGNC